MFRPTTAISIVLFASLPIFLLLTDLADGQTSLTATSASVDGDTLTITLSEAVDASSAADESDFTVSAGDAELSIDTAAVDGTTITLSLAEAVGDSDCDSTAITVSYERAGSSITAATTELQDFASLAVTNRTDNAPEIESIETDTTGRIIYVTFCEAVATGEYGWLTIAAFTAYIDGSSEAINDVFITSGNTKRLEIQFGSAPISEGDSVTVAYDRGDADDGDPPQDADQGAQLVQSWSAREATNRVDSPPVLDSATALWDVITLTYSEALDEDSVPDKSAFTISDKPYELTINSIAVSGSTVSLTVSEVIRGDLDPGFQISYAAPGDSPLQQADGAKQASDFDSQSVVSSTPTTKPVVDSAVVNGNTLTLTFDMPLKNVAPTAALTVGGVEDLSVSAISFSGKVVTLTLSAAVSSSDQVTVTYTKPDESPRIEARNNRDADSFSNHAVTNNTPSSSPTFVSAAINAAGDTLSITMSKALLETSAGLPGAAAFTLAGGTVAVSGVSIDGKTVVLSLSPKADVGETITIAYTQPSGATDGKLQSLSGGHIVESWSAQSVTNNADGVPRPTGATVNGSSLAITFDRALDVMSKPAAAAFTLSGTTTVSSVSIAGSTVTLTLSAEVAHGDEITVSYTKPDSGGIKRSGQALFAESFTSLSVTNETPDPTPTFESAAINAAGDTLSITMSKSLLETTAGVPEASAFTVSGGTAAVSDVSIDGTTIALTLSPKADLGETITIAYTQPTGATDGKLQSVSGGHLVDSWSAQAVTNGADGVPRPTGATVNGSSLAITFDRALDTMSKPAASAFGLTGATPTVSSVSTAGSTVTLTLSAAVAHDDTITVSYSKPDTGGIKRSGQALFAESFASLSVTNETPDPTPTFVSAAINAAGDTLTVTMSTELLATSAGVPEASAFTLAGGTVAVSAVSIDGTTVSLALSPKADLGETITIAYTQPTGAADGKLQSLSGGHLVDSWTAQSVTNGADGVPRPTRATVNGSTLEISFDRALDTTSKPAASAFTLSGTTTVSSVSIAGSTVTLTLSAAVAHGDEITVSYAKPDSSGIKRSGQSLFAKSFTSLSVTNETPDPTPTFVSASINAAGDTLTITMSKALLATSAGVPEASAFTLSGGTAAVSGVSIDGTKIALTLSPKADFGETITIAYTQPTGAADGKLQSLSGGHPVGSWSAQSVTNGADGVPRPTGATINGSTLTVSFDRALDTDSTPAPSAFSLTGATATVSSVSIADSTVTLTLSAVVAHDATITVSYSKPQTDGIKRSGQSLFAESFSSLQVTNATPDPTPTFESAAINAAGDTLSITMSKDLLESSAGMPATSSFVLSGGTVAVSGASITATTVALTLSPKADVGETITIAYTQPSGATDGKLQSLSGGHIVESWSAQSVTNNADGVPRPTGATVNGSSLTISFDRALDAMSKPTASVFSLTGATATVSSVSVADSTVTLTLSALVAHDETITVSYANPQTGGIKRSGQALLAESFSSLSVTNETPDPTPTFVSAEINAAGDTLSITMSKALLETSAGLPGAAAFTVAGGTVAVSGVSIDGKTVALTLSPKADLGETITIAYTQPTGATDGKLQSVSGGHLVDSWTAHSVTNGADGVPRPTGATVNGATLTITFDRALDAMSTPATSVFSLTGATPTVSSVSIADSTVTLTLSAAVAHDATLTVSYSKPQTGGIKRSGQSLFAESFSSLSVTNETPDPTPTFVSSTINASGDTLSITMSTDLLETSAGLPEASAFTLAGGTATVSGVSIDSATVSLALSPKADLGETITIAYTQPTVATDGKLQSSSGGHLVDSWTAQSVANGADGVPRPTGATVNGSSIAISFDRALDVMSKPAASAFTLSGTTTVTSVSIAGSTVTLTLSAEVAHGDEITVSYTKPDSGGIKRSGQALFAESFSSLSVTNETPDPTPTFVSAAINAAGDTLSITMSKSLLETSAGVPEALAFTLAGGTAAVSGVSIDSATVSLTLSPKADVGETITIAYTQPTVSTDGKLQSLSDGHVVDSWTAQSVTNGADGVPRQTGATVNGSSLAITFDRALDAMSTPAASAFTLSGTTTVGSVSISGSTVTLTLSAAVAHDAEITVRYTKPDSGGIKRSGQALFAESFASLSVTNETPDPTPTFVSSAINAAGDTLAITMSKELLETSAGEPEASAFTVVGGTATVSGVSIDGATVALTLSPKADLNETITIAYTQPTVATDGKLQSSSGGHLVDSWTAQSVTNGADGVPRPTGATVNGSSLEISFDRALDTMSKPAASAFTLSGTTTVGSVSIAGSTVTLTLSAAVAHDATITVSYTKPDSGGIKRSGQALFAESFSSLQVTNSTPDPTPTFVSASINSAGDTLAITMRKELLETSAGVPEASTFTLAGGTAAVSGVSIDGSTVALTLSPKADLNETITIAYTQPTAANEGKLQSLSGGHLVDSWTAQSVTNGADGVPRPTGATVNGSTLTVSFDRALDTTSKPEASAFTLSGTTTVSSVSIAGSTVTLTLSAEVAHGDEITVSYTKPDSGGIKRSGQALFAESFSSLSVTNETPVPLISSVVGDERKIEVTFSQALDTDSTPGASAFSLGEDGPSIDSVNVSAMSVSLGLGAALSEGVEYSLAYTAPTESPLTTSDAATVPSFSEAVTNQTDVAPQVQSATADAATVSLVLDQALDTESALTATDFGVSADPAASVSAVSYDGDDGLTLTLTRSLVEDETATLSYVQPSSAGIADPGGKRAASFSLSLDNQTDTAPAPAAGTVKDDKIVINLDQDIFDDPRFQDEDGYPTDHFTVTGIDSSITVDSVQVSNDGPDGVGKIVIALSKAVDELNTVLVRYFPSTGTIRIREDEDGERRAEINNYQLKNLTKTAPSPESVTLNDTALSVVFDRALDEDVSVEAGWFTIESGKLSVETASVSGSTVSLSVTPSATEDADHELTYAAPDTGGLASASGVLVLGFTRAVNNATDYAPFPTSASADATGSVPGANRVVLRFDQRLDPAGAIDTSWFEFTPVLKIKAVTVDSGRSEGDQLVIELTAEQWIREGASVGLSYTQPESGGLRDDDGDPNEEGDGNRVATFSIDVQNNVDVAPQLTSASVNRDLILIEFDQTLDSDDDYVPPPNCEWLEANVAGFDCTAASNPTWFTANRTPAGAASPEVASIAEVGVSGNTVTLRLDERAQRGDTVKLSYQVQSVDGAKWNLRDTTRTDNIVDSFASVNVTNLTAAAPTGKTFDRTEPSKIVVAFDGALREEANLSSEPLRVTADAEPVAVRQVRAAQQELTVDLQRSVPECAALALAYTPEGITWLDDGDRPIVGFSFALENLIDRTHGLACVESDHGALELTLISDTTLSDQGWSLQVNGESRALTVESSAGRIRLVPDSAVCSGDSLTISWMPSDGSPPMSLERAVERAAPCAVLAVAVEDRLELTFDQPLDPSLPGASEFAIDPTGRVTDVLGIEGRVLTLQLESPGIDAEAEATLTYSGTSLRGGGLTVGQLSVPIANQTEPPRFTTGFGLDDLVILNFDRPLQQRTIAAARFELVGPDLEIEIASVTISGSSVQLQLKRSLPDDLDLFGVVYILRGRNGLAGLYGALVSSGGFVVQNYTETAPRAISASVNAREAVLVFNQRIEAADTPAADFVVLAGHREIGASALDWTDRTITLTLTEAVTSLDATRLRYSPGSAGLVQDRSGLPLAAFDMSAENLTPSPRTDAQIIEQARLRAGGGATTFERELSRAFVSSDGARFGAVPGDGVASVALGGLRLSMQLPDRSSDAVGISVSRLNNAPRLMRLLEQVPPACAGSSAGNRVSGWLLELQDPRGAPRMQSVEVLLGGLEAARLMGGCVLDLIAGSWKPMPMDGRVAAPSLIVTGTTSAFTRWVRRTHGA